ncbi:MAG: sugar ABC transporter substrate-binding protein [Mesorhizobium sp.]|nr:sugar ABC transporter substrate-binding protein [bacterium M00.F.Ca.ET.205.01.1.1]TGU55491.1 sugar ABC transporter substrate-binding protein [bacterium M00.F.Ca.ET.152.01.1.1]TGV40226.1 sugar ABC transporter substrate-binding protein [Mesorhizobium sp. M00.F.Ca.ET.186.01.1.1]TGZ45215.1 sugar ABC transporter substrate-binding protein [bacterium M00.F.Ca.ET.162.01.1.1]TIW60659.1 MAG: sugar ABC transporter substrate-binding protein [Mesorhizobium sp.]
MKIPKIMMATAVGLAVSAGSALADSTVRLVEVITSPPRTVLLKKQIAEFEAANPGVKVEVVSLPWGQAFEKLLTMVQAGDTPDVVEMPERWIALYANNGQLADLGPYMAKWDDTKTLGERAKQFGSSVNDTQYMIPYGYYINALFWNKKLFKEAGLDGPPATLDDFVADAKKISAIPGKYGYCLRGGPGAFNGMHMFMNIAQGKGGYFNEDGTSTFNEEGSVKGLQMLADMYKDGSAPKDSVSWGFNETVTGFYSGTCAMLNQDPDALLGVADKMSADDFAVAPLPVGPNGKSYPTLSYVGWTMFANSKVKDDAWKLMATLLSPKDNLEWTKEVGVLPIHNGADQDAHFKTEQFKGWFEELSDPGKYEMVTPPTQLENLGSFVENVAIKDFQQVLLGQKSAKQATDEWAAFLTKEQQDWMAKNKK